MNTNQVHKPNSRFDPVTRMEISQIRAHAEYNLGKLLIPYFRFRVYFTFKPSQQYSTFSQTNKVCYGFENKCSYKQCLTGFAKEIVLDRVYGYEAAIKVIEAKKAQFYSAKLYGRDETNEFNVLHRIYVNGKLEKDSINDPVLSPEEQFKTIYFRIDGGRLQLSEDPLT